ncbi:MAG: hypothetical protein WCK09_16430, partial [Bacteroidota bacterium]
MKIIKLFLLLALQQFAPSLQSQFLSNLRAVKTDALFTTYAAPPERSHYKTDQGYQFQWTDDEAGVEFVSKEGPNLGIAFQFGKRLVFRLQELYREPVVTASYSDLVKYFYYPQQDLRVEMFVAVYSSETAILQCRLINEGSFPVTVSALPYLYYPSSDSSLKIEHQDYTDGYTFPLWKKRDGWMVEHHIPVVENLTGSFQSTLDFDSVSTFLLQTNKNHPVPKSGTLAGFKQSIASQKRNTPFINGIIGFRTFTLQPGESTKFNITINLCEANIREPETPLSQGRGVGGEALPAGELTSRLPVRGGGGDLLKNLLQSSEQAYAKIPKLNFTDKDKEMLYWSSFSLMRQCMMPPEGECRHNYYVFSREPRWGWGYGGQVFHESLVMMAYAYMDPLGAMNSQQVYMDRQQPDGYINYRTGPYLNETIETNGKPTSSA